jgi:hypothetical protein
MGMAMLTRTPQLGLPVYTTDGRRLGVVKAASTSAITIGRRFRRDIHMPAHHIGIVILGDGKTESRVNLSLASYEINMHREHEQAEGVAINPLPELQR